MAFAGRGAHGAGVHGAPMLILYLGFIAFVLGLLALDLGVFHRKPSVESVRGALAWSAGWISLGLAFSGLVYLGYHHGWMGLGTHVDATSTPQVLADGTVIFNDGADAALKYVTGFVVEKSLAVDNIFVIAMIFSSFKVPALYQHRVLFWGIVGALAMRGAMIAIGSALLARFSWVMYVFGGFLVLTGVRMLFSPPGGHDLEDNRALRVLRRLVPTTERYHGLHFFVRAGSRHAAEAATPGAAPEVDRIVAGARKGALLATPLLLALFMVELTDVVFAVDSIPAVFAITSDPFLVFTSNVFAILGLRSLYFALAGMIDRFHHLATALAIVLMLVGTKMLVHGWLRDLLGPRYNLYMLGAILAIIAGGVVASLARPRAATPTAG
jgi:tellurite resistance protein TerC